MTRDNRTAMRCETVQVGAESVTPLVEAAESEWFVG